MINEIFLQVIDGFQYLEENNILHRDIRNPNLMVNNEGRVKIIDFGFGKQINDTDDFDKSISLNWWCDLPDEFSEKIYNFSTEVYFIGKLFELFIRENNIAQFKYKSILKKMCETDPNDRIQNFANIVKEIQSDIFIEIKFSESEKEAYQFFSDCIAEHITKIEHKAEYIDNTEQVQITLENAYRNMMLEEFAPDATTITQCIISGIYYYRQKGFPVVVLKNFLHLLKTSSPEKKRIILANLHTRLDAIPKYSPQLSDEIPF